MSVLLMVLYPKPQCRTHTVPSNSPIGLSEKVVPAKVFIRSYATSLGSPFSISPNIHPCDRGTSLQYPVLPEVVNTMMTSSGSRSATYVGVSPDVSISVSGGLSKGSMVCVGMYRCVAPLGWLDVGGRLAWQLS